MVAHSTVYLRLMLHILKLLVNVLFPEAAPVEKIKDCTPGTFVQYYVPGTYYDTVTLSSYSNLYVQAAIISNKFHHSDHAAKLLASLLSHWLTSLPHANYVLVPIPLSAARLRERGYNQVTNIIKQSTIPSQIKVSDKILTRKRHTKAQSHLERTERLVNLHDAFTASTDPTLKDTQFILLDDVVTTGATLTAARTALQAQFPNNHIICVALAH